MHIKLCLLLWALLSLSITIQAQKHDYNWIFGSFTYSPGEEDNNRGNLLDFNRDTVILDIYEKKDDVMSYSTVYSDASGNLNFWSNGCEIFNVKNEIMQGGDTLNPGLIYEDFCSEGFSLGYLGGHQSMLSLPDLIDERYTYVYHIWTPWAPLDPRVLKYSLIDMQANSGLGAVIKKGIPLVSNVTSGQLTAVKSLDLQSWWVIIPEIESETHFIFEQRGDSIIGPKMYDEGALMTRNNHSSSASAFSPDGSKYAIFGEADGLRLYDFDREQGELSNYQFIPPPGDFDGGWVGLDFSASGRFLYTCHWRKIYQYDMHAEDIAVSRVTVADWIEHLDPDFSVPTMFFKMQRAPDCRIYMSAQNRTKTMHVIHYPDRKGEACMVQQNIPLPAFNTLTLPNFPNYRLGTGEVCDSTKIFPQDIIYTTVTSNANQNKNLAVQVYPNPSRGFVNLVFEKALDEPMLLQLHTVEGKLVYESEIDQGQDAVRLDLSQLPSGMYYYTLWQEQHARATGKVVFME